MRTLVSKILWQYCVVSCVSQVVTHLWLWYILHHEFGISVSFGSISFARNGRLRNRCFRKTCATIQCSGVEWKWTSLEVDLLTWKRFPVSEQHFWIDTEQIIPLLGESSLSCWGLLWFSPTQSRTSKFELLRTLFMQFWWFFFFNISEHHLLMFDYPSGVMFFSLCLIRVSRVAIYASVSSSITVHVWKEPCCLLYP